MNTTQQKPQTLDEIEAALAEWEASYERLPKKEKQKIRRWLATCKRAAGKINPETAEVIWDYVETLDPYGIYPELPEALRQADREYFVRAPRSKVWVRFFDLPPAIKRKLNAQPPKMPPEFDALMSEFERELPF
jgi:hypothetical protein